MKAILAALIQNPIFTALVAAVVPLLLIIPYAIVALYLELKISAHIQDRLGPMRTGRWHGWAQPFADMFKLLQKEDVVPYAADKPLFLLAPVVVFTGAYAAYAAIPFCSAFFGARLNVGVFYIIAVSSFTVVGLLMGGWASNNKWSLLGAMRSAAQIVSYEIPAAMCVLVPVMITGSLDLQDINHLQEGGLHRWIVFQAPPFAGIAFVLYFVSTLAEVNRCPFDIPEADSELVAGYQTEYSGMKFAMFYLAEYANMFAVSAVGSALFLGGWTSPFGHWLSGPVWGVFWFVSKAMAFILLHMWLRWTLPRVRVDQLMAICWKVLVPFSFVNALLAGGSLVWHP
jgi:NADH-quinone oxidoreductase subunit H